MGNLNSGDKSLHSNYRFNNNYDDDIDIFKPEEGDEQIEQERLKEY